MTTIPLHHITIRPHINGLWTCHLRFVSDIVLSAVLLQHFALQCLYFLSIFLQILIDTVLSFSIPFELSDFSGKISSVCKSSCFSSFLRHYSVFESSKVRFATTAEVFPIVFFRNHWNLINLCQNLFLFTGHTNVIYTFVVN